MSIMVTEVRQDGLGIGHGQKQCRLVISRIDDRPGPCVNGSRQTHFQRFPTYAHAAHCPVKGPKQRKIATGSPRGVRDPARPPVRRPRLGHPACQPLRFRRLPLDTGIRPWSNTGKRPPRIRRPLGNCRSARARVDEASAARLDAVATAHESTIGESSPLTVGFRTKLP